jgi:nitrile hydratase accessory protein
MTHEQGTEPIFASPWEARLFALVATMTEAGLIDKTQWALALGTELAAAEARGENRDGRDAYRYWLAALEQIMNEKGLISSVLLEARTARLGETSPHDAS